VGPFRDRRVPEPIDEVHPSAGRASACSPRQLEPSKLVLGQVFRLAATLRPPPTVAGQRRISTGFPWHSNYAVEVPTQVGVRSVRDVPTLGQADEPVIGRAIRHRRQGSEAERTGIRPASTGRSTFRSSTSCHRHGALRWIIGPAAGPGAAPVANSPAENGRSPFRGSVSSRDGFGSRVRPRHAVRRGSVGECLLSRTRASLGYHPERYTRLWCGAWGTTLTVRTAWPVPPGRVVWRVPTRVSGWGRSRSLKVNPSFWGPGARGSAPEAVRKVSRRVSGRTNAMTAVYSWRAS